MFNHYILIFLFSSLTTLALYSNDLWVNLTHFFLSTVLFSYLWKKQKKNFSYIYQTHDEYEQYVTKTKMGGIEIMKNAAFKGDYLTNSNLKTIIINMFFIAITYYLYQDFLGPSISRIVFIRNMFLFSFVFVVGRYFGALLFINFFIFLFFMINVSLDDGFFLIKSIIAILMFLGNLAFMNDYFWKLRYLKSFKISHIRVLKKIFSSCVLASLAFLLSSYLIVEDKNLKQLNQELVSEKLKNKIQQFRSYQERKLSINLSNDSAVKDLISKYNKDLERKNYLLRKENMTYGEVEEILKLHDSNDKKLQSITLKLDSAVLKDVNSISDLEKIPSGQLDFIKKMADQRKDISFKSLAKVKELQEIKKMISNTEIKLKLKNEINTKLNDPSVNKDSLKAKISNYKDLSRLENEIEKSDIKSLSLREKIKKIKTIADKYKEKGTSLKPKVKNDNIKTQTQKNDLIGQLQSSLLEEKEQKEEQVKTLDRLKKIIVFILFFIMIIIFLKLFKKERISKKDFKLSEDQKNTIKNLLLNAQKKRFEDFCEEVDYKYKIIHGLIESVFYEDHKAPPPLILSRNLEVLDTHFININMDQLAKLFNVVHFDRKTNFSKKDRRVFRNQYKRLLKVFKSLTTS